MAGETQAADATATQVQDEDLDADFEAGFDGAATGTTETPIADSSTTQQALEGEGAGKDGATTAAATTQATQGAAPAATPAPGPKKVEVDEAELEALRKRASGAEEQATVFQKQFDKVFGQVGQLKQVIDKLRTETPAGEAVAISEADFKELTDAYPEIGKLTAQGLNKVLAKVKGTGGADPEAIDKMVTERVQAARGEITGQVTDAVLNSIVPRWRQQVNTPTFDAWIKSQKPEVQSLAQSDDLGDASEMLRMYRQHLDRPAPTPAPTAAPAAQGQPRGTTRQRQIAAAVTTRGDGTASSNAPAEEDDFESGFKAGKA